MIGQILCPLISIQIHNGISVLLQLQLFDWNYILLGINNMFNVFCHSKGQLVLQRFMRGSFYFIYHTPCSFTPTDIVTQTSSAGCVGVSRPTAPPTLSLIPPARLRWFYTFLSFPPSQCQANSTWYVPQEIITIAEEATFSCCLIHKGLPQQVAPFDLPDLFIFFTSFLIQPPRDLCLLPQMNWGSFA